MNSYVYVGVIIDNQLEKYFEGDPKDGYINEDAIPDGMEILSGEFCDNVILGMPLTEYHHGFLEPENYSKSELDLTFKTVQEKTGLEPFLFIGCVNN